MADEQPSDRPLQLQQLRELLQQSPMELSALVSDAITALCMLHQARITELELVLEQAADCGCPDCRDDLPRLARSLAAFSVDLQRLISAGDAIQAAEGDFEVDSGFVQARLAEFEASCAQHDRRHDPTVQTLNRLLEQDGEGEVG